MSRASIQFVMAMVVFLVLFAFLTMALVIQETYSSQPPEAFEFHLGNDLERIAGNATARTFSPDGDVFFAAAKTRVRVWLVAKKSYPWSDSFDAHGAEIVSVAAREVETGDGPAWVELAALARAAWKVRFYRVRPGPTEDIALVGGRWGVDLDLAADLNQAQKETTLGKPDRLLYRPGTVERTAELVVLFENGWARRYRVPREGEPELLPWFSSDKARERGQSETEFLRLHTGKIDDASISADGSLLVTASARDRRVRFLRFEDDFLGPESGAPDEIYVLVAASPDGSYLAAAKRDGRINLYRVEGAKVEIRRTLEGSGRGIRGLAFQTGPDRLLAADDDDIRLWDLSRGATTRRFDAGRHPLVAWRSYIYDRANKLVAATEDGTFHVWTLPED
ncbi:MAG: hypothetical protein HY720_20295 [Planctomycetes bacterium]|nr:hypothetical protein [Planctomycetota bacterium]